MVGGTVRRTATQKGLGYEKKKRWGGGENVSHKSQEQIELRAIAPERKKEGVAPYVTDGQCFDARTTERGGT